MKNTTSRYDHRVAADDTYLTVSNDEETLVVDGRAAVSPSQQVEQRLMTRLKATPVLMSQMQRRLRPR